MYHRLQLLHFTLVVLVLFALIIGGCGGETATQVSPESGTETPAVEPATDETAIQQAVEATIAASNETETTVAPTSSPQAESTNIPTNVPEPSPTFRPTAPDAIEVELQLGRSVEVVSLTEQLSFAPAEGGGGGNLNACFLPPSGVSALDDTEPVLYPNALDVNLGQTVTLCYFGIPDGTIEERVIGPSGQEMRATTFSIDDARAATDYTVILGDAPGTYTVISQTPAGELRTTFEVTEQLFDTYGTGVLRVVGRNNTYIDNLPETSEYIVVAGFEPGKVLDLGFFEHCIIPGTRRHSYGSTGNRGRVLVTAGQIQVNNEGFAWIPISDDIRQQLTPGVPFDVFATGEPTEQANTFALNLTDPLALMVEERALSLFSSKGPILINGSAITLRPCPPSQTLTQPPSDLPESPWQIGWQFAPPEPVEESSGRLSYPDIHNLFISDKGGYILSEETIYLLNAKTGETQQNLPISFDLLTSFGSSGSFLINNRLYVAVSFSETTITAIDITTGREVWRTQIEADSDAFATLSALVTDGTKLYIASDNNELYLVNQQTGEPSLVLTSPIEWSTELVDIFAMPGSGPATFRPSIAIGGDIAYIGGDDGQLYAVDINTKDTLWTTPLELGPSAAPVVSDDTVYVGSYAGYLYALDRTTGEQQWRTALGDWVNVPAVADDTVYVSSENNNLYAIDRESGEILWYYTTGSPITAGPVVGDDNDIIYFASFEEIVKDTILPDGEPTTEQIPHVYALGAPEAFEDISTSSSEPVANLSPEVQSPSNVSASDTAPSGIDSQGNTVTYEPSNVVDGQLDTTWRVPGNGVGQFLLLEFNNPMRINEVRIVPGYAKIDPFDGTDRFLQSRRVRRVRLEFSDGSSTEAPLTEQPELQPIPVEPVVTDFVRVVILETTEHGGRDFTAISEIEVIGTEETQ